MEPLTLAFLVTLGAGLATGIGSFLAFAAKSTNKKFLSFMLGLSAGVMIYVSLVEIFQKSVDSLAEAFGDHGQGYLFATLGFFGGVIIIYAIDHFLHKSAEGSPHEAHEIEEMDEATEEERQRHALMKMGVFTALAIAIHNFPEGLATFISTVQDPALGIALAVAVAIHNVPEGIAVSIPIYHATGSRIKAFWYSFASGLAEPVGAVLGYFLLIQFISDQVFGVIFAGVAGIMVFIALDELLPAAQKYGFHHHSIMGAIIGMVVMASSLVLFVL